MAEAQTTVVLNIGSQKVAMAIFEIADGELILQDYKAIYILADPATEASRLPQIRVAISELVESLNVPKATVRYILSGQAVFTRYVKLPPLAEDNIEQLVRFEAQQHVPFPIDEVVWDYEMLDTQDSETEVLLVAIKSDALNEMNALVIDTGLRTEKVEVAPVALLNAFRHSYGTEAECSLVVDIGARTCDLIYVDGPIFFTRSISVVSGSSLTTAIAKEYRVGFSEAEDQKTTNGLIALGGGHTTQLDEATAALAMVLRNALSKLPAEIARTTNYFRSQHGGTAPKHVYLSGGGANLPYLKEFFEEKLRLPIDFFNPLQQVKVRGDVDEIGRVAHTMGELVGAGIGALDKEMVRIDLVPESVGKDRELNRQKPFLIGAVAAIILGAIIWAGAQFYRAGESEKLASQAEVEVRQLRPFDAKIKNLDKTYKSISAMAGNYEASVNNRTFWLRAVDEIRDSFTHEAVWITEMEPIAGLDLEASGGKSGEQSMVSESFPKAVYGGSSMNVLKAVTPQPRSGRRTPRGNPSQAESSPLGLNAIVIRGFWMENRDRHNVVYQLLADLRKKAMADGSTSVFTFQLQKGKQQQTLADETLIRKIVTTATKEEYAWPFEIVLPLKPVATSPPLK